MKKALLLALLPASLLAQEILEDQAARDWLQQVTPPSDDVCQPPKTSAPKCVDYDPGTVDKKYRYQSAGCRTYEIVAIDNFTGKECMIGGICVCEEDS